MILTILEPADLYLSLLSAAATRIAKSREELINQSTELSNHLENQLNFFGLFQVKMINIF